MKSSLKKSAVRWLLSGFTALTLAISLAACSETANESPELEKTADASLVETAEFVPASAEGPARNVPEPRLPITATENSVDGAESALLYFWEAAQYLRVTGEAVPMSFVSSERCEFCTTFMNDWQETYGSGAWAVPDGEVELSISESWVGQEEEEGLHSVDILFSISEPNVVVFDQDGQKLNSVLGDDSPDITEWFAVMSFDATAQQWIVEWIGLEELVSWED